MYGPDDRAAEKALNMAPSFAANLTDALHHIDGLAVRRHLKLLCQGRTYLSDGQGAIWVGGPDCTDDGYNGVVIH